MNLEAKYFKFEPDFDDGSTAGLTEFKESVDIFIDELTSGDFATTSTATVLASNDFGVPSSSSGVGASTKILMISGLFDHRLDIISKKLLKADYRRAGMMGDSSIFYTYTPSSLEKIYPTEDLEVDLPSVERQACACNFVWERWSVDGSRIVDSKSFTVICANLDNVEINQSKPYIMSIYRLVNVSTKPRVVARNLGSCATTDFCIIGVDSGIRRHFPQDFDFDFIYGNDVVQDMWECAGKKANKFSVDSKTNGYARNLGQRNRRSRILVIDTKLYRKITNGRDMEVALQKKDKDPEFDQLTSSDEIPSESNVLMSGVQITSWRLGLNQEGRVISPHYLCEGKMIVE